MYVLLDAGSKSRWAAKPIRQTRGARALVAGGPGRLPRPAQLVMAGCLGDRDVSVTVSVNAVETVVDERALMGSAPTECIPSLLYGLAFARWSAQQADERANDDDDDDDYNADEGLDGANAEAADAGERRP